MEVGGTRSSSSFEVSRLLHPLAPTLARACHQNPNSSSSTARRGSKRPPLYYDVVTPALTQTIPCVWQRLAMGCRGNDGWAREMRCAAAAGAAEMRSPPSIPASARSIDQLWQEMTDPPAAFPCLRARCAVHKALHCTSLHATTVHGSSRRRLPLGLCLLPYPLLVDVGRLSLCSASMHARWLHGEAAKKLYPPSSFFFFFCPRSCRCKWPPCAGGPVQCRRPPQPHTGGHRSAQKTPDELKSPQPAAPED